MRYVSCFSGIGGLEASVSPALFCESNDEARLLLNQLYPDVEVWSNIEDLHPPKCDVVAGGWPCQDLSVAGRQAGLSGLRSKLLLEMLRVAKEGGSHTVVAENVSNLLRMNSGQEFSASLAAFHTFGFEFVAWRTINAREFGLPQHRSRLLIVASKDRGLAESLFRPFPNMPEDVLAIEKAQEAAGFYWTAGTHSINYSFGYVPTIKIGSSLGIPSPPAIHFGNTIRQLSADEALRLQGFEIPASKFVTKSAAFRAAGNAVAKPIGRWVLDGVASSKANGGIEWKPQQQALFVNEPLSVYPVAGLSIRGLISEPVLAAQLGCLNLIDFVDKKNLANLSGRAARGLLKRIGRSGQACPTTLQVGLEAIAAGAEES